MLRCHVTRLMSARLVSAARSIASVQKELSNHAGSELNKVPMSQQSTRRPAKNFEEVTLGYTAEMAVEEAACCLNCKNKPA